MTDPSYTVRPMTTADWPAVDAIYRDGIATGNATFEAEPPTWEAFDAGKLPEHRFVAVDGDEVLGWVAVSPTSARPVYRGVVEHSVYVATAARGRGVGHVFFDALIASTEAGGIWTIQSGIFPENTASRAFHARHGFRELGTRERVGLMTFGPWAGQWLDNVIVERRRARAVARQRPRRTPKRPGWNLKPCRLTPTEHRALATVRMHQTPREQAASRKRTWTAPSAP